MLELHVSNWDSNILVRNAINMPPVLNYMAYFSEARVRFYPKRKKGKMYWLDHVRCEGDEDNLLACQYIKGSDNCAKMAGVICDGKITLCMQTSCYYCRLWSNLQQAPNNHQQ